MAEAWHSITVEEAAGRLGVRLERGLSSSEAEERLRRYGFNELMEAKGPSALQIFLSQFKNILIIILLAATGISFILGEVVDAALIIIIVILAAVLGFFQEYRAEKSLEALKRLLSPRARVLRDGEVREIEARLIVPGDILVLEAGDRVPADARVIECRRLQVDEAPLTGESVPVEKTVSPLPPSTPLPERRNMVYAGTTVTYGRGRALVVATGMETEFGRIARGVMEVEEEKTPLERRMEELGHKLGKLVVAVAAIVVAAGVAERFINVGTLTTKYLLDVGLFGVALAVAVIPEALPAIIVGSLAVAMRMMAQRNALVRRMASVETLGSITVICSDKTGTLTKGEMTVREIHVDGGRITVSGAGYEPRGRMDADDPSILEGEAFKLLVMAATLCNDARLVQEDGRWRIRGDPTEGALLVAAKKAGIEPETLRETYPRIDELPFSSERKRMTTIHRVQGTPIAFMKGAPEVVLERCSRVMRSNKVMDLTPEERERILEKAREMASRALRVLAFSYKELDDSDPEEGHVFLGLVGMMDPPREDAVEAVKVCKRVGIKPVMITGDHKLTAVAVAREMGIYREGDLVLTGSDLERMSEEELERVVERVSVYARVSPIHKLKIVKALKARGHVVAMTGDGVNDAPALKQADIGVAMGVTGTEVAKEAADMVLADDNFATIVKAIELGRWVYDNIKKYLAYLLEANLVEIVVLSIGFLATSIPPLKAKHILYINLATDGLPALALGFTPPDPDVMRRPPRDPRESVFTVDVTSFLVRAVLIEAPLLLLIYFMAPALGFRDPLETTTVLFLSFVFIEFVVAVNARSLTETILKLRPHKWLILSIMWEVALLFSIIYLIPGGAEALGVERIPLRDYIPIIMVAAAVFVSMEATKLFVKRRVQRRREAMWERFRELMASPRGGYGSEGGG